jgi:Flp pilus assembly protein TadB
VTAQPLAALLLAAAALVVPGPVDVRERLARVVGTGGGVRGDGSTGAQRRAAVPERNTWLLPAVAGLVVAALPVTVAGWPFGAAAGSVLGLGMFYGSRRALRAQGTGGRRAAPTDPLRLAACWDLLAACLRAGLPVPVAVRAVAGELPETAGDALRRSSELMALGADPVAAWAPALDDPDTAPLARAARRTARSGTALAGAALELAGEVRSSTHDHEEARAQRAAVLITGPLGICYLPAFLCLGVLPVVMALASRLMSAW